MKINIFISISIIGLTLVAGCKNLLHPHPEDFLSPVNYYENAEQLRAALAGVYDPLSGSRWYGDDFKQRTTLNTDEEVREGQLNTPDIAFYNITPSMATVGAFWNELWRGVNHANTLLENIHKATDISGDERRHILGETKFLRAFYLFTLTNWFGDIPLRTSSTKSAGDSHMAFTPTKEVYDFVIREMTEAEGLLIDQPASAYTYNEVVTLTTVQGMLARVCLYAAGQPVNDTERYADALFWADKVVASGEHRLNPNYNEVFRLHAADAYDNVHRESMWEAGFTYDPANPTLREGANNRVGMATSSRFVGNTGGSTRVVPQLYRSYETIIDPTTQMNISPDLRRERNVPSYRWGAVGNHTALPAKTLFGYLDYYERFPGKWRREEETVLPKDGVFTPQNHPILRYADVLLMLAEAENELNGPTELAIDAVNQVRRRGYGGLLPGESIIGIKLEDRGMGYTSVPTVTIAGNGQGATAEATIAGGSVARIVATSLGQGYTSATVTIEGGGGAGATATPIFSGIVDPDLKPDQFASKEAFRKAIQDERLRELSFEFLRKRDLLRWGLLVPVMQEQADEAFNGFTLRYTAGDLTQTGTVLIPPVPANLQLKYTQAALYVGEKDFFLPIPEIEIDYNRLSTQNPGY